MKPPTIAVGQTKEDRSPGTHRQLAESAVFKGLLDDDPKCPTTKASHLSDYWRDGKNWKTAPQQGSVNLPALEPAARSLFPLLTNIPDETERGARPDPKGKASVDDPNSVGKDAPLGGPVRSAIHDNRRTNAAGLPGIRAFIDIDARGLRTGAKTCSTEVIGNGLASVVEQAAQEADAAQHASYASAARNDWSARLTRPKGVESDADMETKTAITAGEKHHGTLGGPVGHGRIPFVAKSAASATENGLTFAQDHQCANEVDRSGELSVPPAVGGDSICQDDTPQRHKKDPLATVDGQFVAASDHWPQKGVAARETGHAPDAWTIQINWLNRPEAAMSTELDSGRDPDREYNDIATTQEYPYAKEDDLAVARFEPKPSSNVTPAGEFCQDGPHEVGSAKSGDGAAAGMKPARALGLENPAATSWPRTDLPQAAQTPAKQAQSADLGLIAPPFATDSSVQIPTRATMPIDRRPGTLGSEAPQDPALETGLHEFPMASNRPGRISIPMRPGGALDDKVQAPLAQAQTPGVAQSVPVMPHADANVQSLLDAISHNPSWKAHLAGPFARLAQIIDGTGKHADILRITLHPESLGCISASIRKSAEDVIVHIEVESDEAYRAFGAGMEAIQSGIRSTGYKVSEIIVEHHSPGSTKLPLADDQQGGFGAHRNTAHEQRPNTPGRRNGNAEFMDRENPHAGDGASRHAGYVI